MQSLSESSSDKKLAFSVSRTFINLLEIGNLLLLYSLLVWEWLLNYWPGKKGAGFGEERGLLSSVKTAFLRFLTLKWRFAELQTEEQRSNVYLTLQTSFRTEDNSKGKERVGKQAEGLRTKLLESSIEDDRVLKVINVTNQGFLGRCLLGAMFLIPFAPEMVLALVFFWSTYLASAIYCLTNGLRNYSLLYVDLSSSLQSPCLEPQN